MRAPAFPAPSGSARAGSRCGGRAGALGIAAAILLLGACESPTVPPRDRDGLYNFALLTNPPLVLRWPAGSTIRVFQVPEQDAERQRVLREGLEHGMAVWNRIAIYGEFRFEEVASPAAADVVLAWAGASLPLVTADCEPGSGGQAVITFCADDPSNPRRLRPYPVITESGIQDGPVRMVILVQPGQLGDPAVVRRLVAHELGHALGIARHSPDRDDLMWNGVLTAEAPSRADQATVRVLYQTRPDIVP